MFIQCELECLQGWRLHNFSGQPAPWHVLQFRFILGNPYWSFSHEKLAHQHEDFVTHMVVRGNNKRNAYFHIVLTLTNVFDLLKFKADSSIS